jgi:hypothetical protein
MTITVKQLRKLKACEEQVDLFKKLFGESVEITEALIKEHSAKFDIYWLAKNLFSGSLLATYEASRDQLWATYEASHAIVFFDCINQMEWTK